MNENDGHGEILEVSNYRDSIRQIFFQSLLTAWQLKLYGIVCYMQLDISLPRV